MSLTKNTKEEEEADKLLAQKTEVCFKGAGERCECEECKIKKEEEEQMKEWEEFEKKDKIEKIEKWSAQNKQNKMDGHFWVVRDGKIIDPYFDNYDYVIKINKLEGDRVYLPASPLIQQIMKKKFIDNKIQMIEWGLNQNYKAFNIGQRRSDCCNINAIFEMKQNGGEIIFGSMGWKHRGSDKIWWEYGGEDYTVKQFINN